MSYHHDCLACATFGRPCYAHTDPTDGPPTIDTEPSEPPPVACIDPDPDPLPPWPCATCQGAGPCLDCGARDIPAIGRKIKYLLHHDTNAFIAILNGTQRRWWPLLAHGYALAVGVVGDAEAERVVVDLWAELVAA